MGMKRLSHTTSNLVDHPFFDSPQLARNGLPLRSRGRINRPFCSHWEVLMTDREKWDQDHGAMSRRTLVKGIAAGEGAVMAGTGGEAAQTGPGAPPTASPKPPALFGLRYTPSTQFGDPVIP